LLLFIHLLINVCLFIYCIYVVFVVLFLGCEVFFCWCWQHDNMSCCSASTVQHVSVMSVHTLLLQRYLSATADRTVHGTW